MRGLELAGLGLAGGGRRTAPLGPADVDGLVLWLDSRLGISVTAGNVAAWANQAGPIGWVQSAVARRPQYVAGDPSFVRFDGTNQEYLYAVSPQAYLDSLPFSIFIVASLSGTGPDPLLGHIGTPRLRFEGDTVAYRGPGGELTFSRSTARAVRSFHHDGTDIYYRQAGVELARTARALGAQATTALRLGNDGATGWLNGDVFSVLLYSRATGLTSEQILGLEQYLAAEFL